MLDLHAKIRLSVAAVLVLAVSWFLPEALVSPAAVPHERAAGWLTRAPALPVPAAPPPAVAQADAAQTAASEHVASQGVEPSTAPAAGAAAAPSAAAPLAASAVNTAPASAEAAPADGDATPKTAAVVHPADAEALHTQGEPVPADDAKGSAARQPGPPPHSWAVQVGSFGTRVTAQRRADELTAAGWTAYVSPVRMGRHKLVYRVRAPAPDRDSALDLALQLRLAGYDVSLARP